MIKRSEDFSFLAGAIVTTVILLLVLLSQEIVRFDTLTPSASKVESIHNITIINATEQKEQEPKKVVFKKLVKKNTPKRLEPKKITQKKEEIEKPLVKKQVIDEDALIKEKLAHDLELKKQNELQKKMQKQLEQEKKRQELLAAQEEIRRTQIARANKLKKQKDEYLIELTQWIKQHLNYPRSALRRNQEGVVKVSFIINKDGAIHSVKVVSACPYKKLNEAAKKLLIKHNQFKPIPKQISKWELNLPIVYALRD